MKKTFIFMMVMLVEMLLLSAPIDVWIEAVKKGTRIDLGISKFSVKNIKDKKSAENGQQIVRDDIMFTRIFNVVDPGWQYLPNKEVSKKWKSYGVDVVVCGEIEVIGEDYILKGTMYDIESTEKIYEKEFRAKDLRYVAHLFSDNIIMSFTGEYGIATSRIVFSNDMTGNKEIYIMDYDGYNLKQLTNNKSVNIYPRVSPDGKKIIYTTYKDTNPDLYVMDINGNNQKPLSSKQGLNITANWSYDGEKIIMTMSRAKHNPNMFLLDSNGNIIKRLTFGNSSDVSGFFSPNNREIVFTSDRAGYPQLYISDIDGINVRRLYTSGYADSPMWSPKGDRITFCQRGEQSMFDIYNYDISKNEHYRLTQGSSNENPYFSPDGRFIVFSSNRFGKYELFTMFLDGSNQRRITQIKGNCYTPCWTPRRM